MVEGLPLAQADRTEELKGPRVGAPPQAMEGFLKKAGLTQDQLVERDGVYYAELAKTGRPTAEIVAESLGLPIAIDPDLREVGFGVHEGQKMGDWFPDWLAGDFTPEGGESFPTLRARSVAALNRAIVQPPVVLVVAHGAVFRALRAAMGIVPNASTRNAAPIWCEAPTTPGGAWKASYLEE